MSFLGPVGGGSIVDIANAANVLRCAVALYARFTDAALLIDDASKLQYLFQCEHTCSAFSDMEVGKLQIGAAVSLIDLKRQPMQ